MKKLTQKTTVLPCNVHTALHCIYKKLVGATNESRCAAANSSASYVERNKKYEEIRVKVYSGAELPKAVCCFS